MSKTQIEARREPQAATSSGWHAAAWSGIVFALVSLFCILNIVPPVHVAYRVRTQVVMSPVRLAQLQKLVSAEDRTNALEETQHQLTYVEVLDRKAVRAASREKNSSGKEEQLLVDVQSLWLSRPLEGDVVRWIQQLSSVPGVPTDATSLAKQLRHDRWQLSMAEHYAARHEHVEAPKLPTTPDNRRTFQLATAVASDGVAATPVAHLDDDGIKGELVAAVAAARRQLDSSERAWTEHVNRLSGEFRPVGKNSVLAKPSSIPFHFAASVLVLGLASGSIAGWFQYRLQSGGFHVPGVVAAQLARDGLPTVGTVEIAGIETQRRTIVARLWGGLAGLPRLIGRRFTRLSELALAIWCIAIVTRFCIDPLWRDMLANNPLAAFGRLVAGLP